MFNKNWINAGFGFFWSKNFKRWWNKWFRQSESRVLSWGAWLGKGFFWKGVIDGSNEWSKEKRKVGRVRRNDRADKFSCLVGGSNNKEFCNEKSELLDFKGWIMFFEIGADKELWENGVKDKGKKEKDGRGALDNKGDLARQRAVESREWVCKNSLSFITKKLYFHWVVDRKLSAAYPNFCKYKFEDSSFFKQRGYL